MKQKNEPIKQHYVPRVYLKNFSVNNQIYVLNKKRNKIFSTGINNICAENDFYTLKDEDGFNSYDWEKKYAEGIEPIMGNLFPSIISRGNYPAQNFTRIINEIEKQKLAIIMSQQLLRCKQARIIMYDWYKNSISDLEKHWMFNTNFNFSKLLSEEIFKEISVRSITGDQEILLANLLYNRNYVFYKIYGNKEFITSDNPIMTYNYGTNNCTLFSNGLADKKTITFYPLSPTLLLCTYSHKYISHTFKNLDKCIIFLNSKMENDFIENVNKKQIEQCNMFAIAKSNNIFYI
mgnify:CR=1 FL=1